MGLYPPEAKSVDVEAIEDPLRLTEMRKEWHEIWERLPYGTPFQSPEWLLPWWRQYGEGTLASFLFWSKNELVGVAPLYIFTDSVDQVRRMVLLGTGNTDYLDVVFRPEFSTQCRSALLRVLHETSSLWDECDFQQLRWRSPLLQNISYSARFRAKLHQQGSTQVVDLLSTEASNSMLKKAKSCRRKLEEIGPVTFEEATPQSVEEIIGSLEQLHEDRWRMKNLPGVFGHPRDRYFHRQVAREFSNRNMLRLYGLRIHGELIAALYGFCYQKRTYLYLSGFDPSYAHLSIGTILLGYAVEEARQQGGESLDFLRGQEPYKYKWGATDQAIYRLTIGKTLPESG